MLTRQHLEVCRVTKHTSSMSTLCFAVRAILQRLIPVLPSSTYKVWCYRQLGMTVGRGVHLGKGVTIEARGVVLGDHVRLGDGTHIGGLRSVIIGAYTEIGRGALITGDDNLSIGQNCYIGHFSVLNVRAPVTIDDNVALGGAFGQLWTHGAWAEDLAGYQQNKIAPIRLGSEVWIGASVIVLPGVTIGERTIVGAGAVVTRDLPPGATAFGVPARVAKYEGEYRATLTPVDVACLTEALIEKYVATRCALGFQSRRQDLPGCTQWQLERKLLRTEQVRIVLLHFGEDAAKIAAECAEETLLVSLTPIPKSACEALGRRVAYFDIVNRRCSNKHLKHEINFHSYARQHYVRFFVDTPAIAAGLKASSENASSQTDKGLSSPREG